MRPTGGRAGPELVAVARSTTTPHQTRPIYRVSIYMHQITAPPSPPHIPRNPPAAAATSGVSLQPASAAHVASTWRGYKLTVWSLYVPFASVFLAPELLTTFTSPSKT